MSTACMMTTLKVALIPVTLHHLFLTDEDFFLERLTFSKENFADNPSFWSIILFPYLASSLLYFSFKNFTCFKNWTD